MRVTRLREILDGPFLLSHDGHHHSSHSSSPEHHASEDAVARTRRSSGTKERVEGED